MWMHVRSWSGVRRCVSLRGDQGGHAGCRVPRAPPLHLERWHIGACVIACANININIKLLDIRRRPPRRRPSPPPPTLPTRLERGPVAPGRAASTAPSPAHAMSCASLGKCTGAGQSATRAASCSGEEYSIVTPPVAAARSRSRSPRGPTPRAAASKSIDRTRAPTCQRHVQLLFTSPCTPPPRGNASGRVPWMYTRAPAAATAR